MMRLSTGNNKKALLVITLTVVLLSLSNRISQTSKYRPSLFIGGSFTIKYSSALNDDIAIIRSNATSIGAEPLPLDLDAMYYGSQLMNHSEGLPQLSIVGQLGGELGNYLCRIGHAFVIWRKLQNNHPQFDYRIVLRHGSKREWPGKFLRVKPDIDRCFPVLRKFDLGQANVPEFDSRLEEQEKLGWMQDFSKINQNPSSVLPALANFTQIATNFRQDTGQSAISMPFLLSDSYVGFSGFIEYADEYYEELRRIFEIDEKIEACCALRPDPDETVFHHRNFQAELPKRAISSGLEEMGPYQTAHDLLGHLQAGDKVAILSRFSAKEEQPYIDAMKQRGLQVRFIDGQTGVQDFCFLKSAQKEVIGTALSTYVFWAGILGNASNVRLYMLDTPEQRRGLPIDYVWKHPDLKDRFRFELHQVNRTIETR